MIFFLNFYFFHVVKQQYVFSNIIKVKINIVIVLSCTNFCKVVTYELRCQLEEMETDLKTCKGDDESKQTLFSR